MLLHHIVSMTQHPHPLLFTQNENRVDGYWCINVSVLTNIVILPITSPRSHPFEIFRAKRLFGGWAFCNSALIRLQMENPAACPSIIYFPLLAFESNYNRCNYARIICATGNKPASSYTSLHKLFTKAAFVAVAVRQRDLFWQKKRRRCPVYI